VENPEPNELELPFARSAGYAAWMIASHIQRIHLSLPIINKQIVLFHENPVISLELNDWFLHDLTKLFQLYGLYINEIGK
jgi:hypothetical protein